MMTEEQIERKVEAYVNAADSALMNRRMTQVEYDFHMKAINRWADRHYNKATGRVFGAFEIAKQ